MDEVGPRQLLPPMAIRFDLVDKERLDRLRLDSTGRPDSGHAPDSSRSRYTRCDASTQCLAEVQRSPIAIEPCRYFWPLAVCLAERLCDGEVAELDATELYRDYLRLERHRVGDAADLGIDVTILPCCQARHRIVEGGANQAEQRHQRSARQQRPPYVAAAGGEETDPAKLAALGDLRLHASDEELQDALQGQMHSVQRHLCTTHLERLDVLDR